MDDGIVGKIIAQGPKALPLGASLAFFNVYQDMRPELPRTNSSLSVQEFWG